MSEEAESASAAATAAEPTRPRPAASPLPETASAHGGASGTEDTTRAAGYVVDLASPQAPPPGPPVELTPTLLAPPDEPPPRARRAGPGRGSAADAARGTDGVAPTFDDLALARMEGESPSTGAAPSTGGVRARP